MRQSSHRTREENHLYWPLEVLTGYLQTSQDRLLATQLPFISEQFSFICDKHRKTHPEIVGLSDFFADVTDDLRREMSKDAELYFPYIHHLAECHHCMLPLPVPEFSSISSVVHLTHANHNSVLKSLGTIIEMSFTFNKFTQVDSAYNLLVSSLNELEDDLQTLIHLKFDILYKRAVEMERIVGRNHYKYQFTDSDRS
jgi:regulator of cell morphogenesis and NO signaling